MKRDGRADRSDNPHLLDLRDTGECGAAVPHEDGTMAASYSIRVNKETRRKNEKEKSGWRRSVTRVPIEGSDMYETVAAILLGIMIAVGVPEYLHPKSNHVFTHRQRIAMLVLLEFTGRSHEEFCRLLPTYKGFCGVMGIRTVPHPSSLSRFREITDEDELLRMVGYFGTVCADRLAVAADGTALSNYDRSAHYESRLKDFGAAPKRTFTKLSSAADADTLLVLACAVSEGSVHDSVHAPSLLDMLAGSGIDVEFFIADKAYDGEPLHRLVKDILNAKALIPARENTPKKGAGRYRTKGRNRSEMKRLLGKKCTIFQWNYQLRALIECVNSIVKRKFGSSVRAKKENNRVQSAICRIIAYNLDRILNLGLVRSIRGV